MEELLNSVEDTIEKYIDIISQKYNIPKKELIDMWEGSDKCKDLKETPIAIENRKTRIKTILCDLIRKYNIKSVSEKLNLSPGTISRWVKLNSIPIQYEFDILKLSKIKIDYSKYSYKEKDQFFTNEDTVRYCFDIFCKTILKYGENYKNFKYIEPSAGNGSFLSILPEDTIALDVEPLGEKIIEQDYLDWFPKTTNEEKYVVFGNPPFGLRGHTALKFINHSYNFADYVCFILPQLFESDGKGVPRKRIKGYNLISSIKLNSYFYEPSKKNQIKINTVFQIWSKHHNNEEYNIKIFNTENIKIYSISEGSSSGTTRNKNMIGKCDVYIPSTCFGKENMKCYLDFENLPGRRGYGIIFLINKNDMVKKMLNTDWTKISFLSTNSAYNLRSSQIYDLFNV